MRTNRSYTATQKAKAVALYVAKAEPTEIAKFLGVTVKQVKLIYPWLKAAGVDTYAKKAKAKAKAARTARGYGKKAAVTPAPKRAAQTVSVTENSAAPTTVDGALAAAADLAAQAKALLQFGLDACIGQKDYDGAERLLEALKRNDS